ncbi:MAG: GNAT family N-acetyltransferase [Anaerolineae bacterium]|nr:GNAT family N-acetyltransferase [Anaerolineae bacterium]
MTESTTPKTYSIRQAQPNEASLLTELNWRSKAYWGYDDDFMNLVRDEMITTAEDIINEHVYILENSDHRIMGFYELKTLDNHLHLDALFIDPSVIGLGYGRALFNHAASLAVELGFNQFTLEADPNAEAFYLKLGARRVGERESRIKGRFLPQMLYSIPAFDIDN